MPIDITAAEAVDTHNARLAHQQAQTLRRAERVLLEARTAIVLGATVEDLAGYLDLATAVLRGEEGR